MKNAIIGAALAACVLGVSPVLGRDAQTLADIRQEAAVLSVELSKLTRELSTTGAPNTGLGAGSTLDRVNTMEASLSQLTGQIEQLEFRIGRIVADGTRQLDDMNFRICELEAGCDIGNLPALEPIGGAVPAAQAAAPIAAAPTSNGAGQLAASEQIDFDAAKAAYDQGNFSSAALAFETFAQNYTAGFLTAEAYFLRGESLTQLGQTSDAARAYLNSFNTSADGSRAPASLLRLGTSMVALGHVDKGCVMLAEVGTRFATAPEVAQANTARQSLGCQ